MAYKYKAVRLEGNKFVIVQTDSGDMWAEVICEGEDNEEGIDFSSLVVSSLNNNLMFQEKYYALLKEKK